MPHLQLSGTALHGQGAHTDGQRSVPTFPYCHTERAAGSRGQEHPAAGQTEAQQCLTAAKGPDESARAIGVICYQGVGHSVNIANLPTPVTCWEAEMRQRQNLRNSGWCTHGAQALPPPIYLSAPHHPNQARNP